ncbi:MAG TPA: phosphoribosylaminoimidazolesuccinocarboxamide synthase [Deltaproteobacteria bacterium]|nr:MAG: phosphoribosylaminoimidazolesuccinocarboxamide synthase [Deltaproteobacteria bacterium GWA2_45_12]HBF13077.1 phosphoribosylaminoimidazolesuccinocarboxamide synthase [Deltaproteobacteria bacterium]
MEKKEKLYEGKAKIIYKTNDPDLYIAYFKDDATAFNNQKKGTILDKGIVNNSISSRLFQLLSQNKIQNHFVEKLSDREMLIKKLTMLPLEVIVRNVAAGSFAKRYGKEEGLVLSRPLLEFCLKDDSLGDPFLNDDAALILGLCHQQQLLTIRNYALMINTCLSQFFDSMEIRLIDFKLEFGLFKGDVLLGDEVTPDTCRLWDKKTDEKLDKDRFRRDMGGVEEAYKTVFDRVMQSK